MLLSFRLDERPGESHLALDGKKFATDQGFAALGDCLKCFLLLRRLWVFAQVAGFHLNDCIELSTGPPAPLRLLPKFAAERT